MPHGFRSSFRDWAGEETDHPREVIEAALAHVVRNQVEAAYARSDLFERRRVLMDDWARYLAQGTGGGFRGLRVKRPVDPAGGVENPGAVDRSAAGLGEGFPHLLGRAHPAHRLHRPGGGLFVKKPYTAPRFAVQGGVKSAAQRQPGIAQIAKDLPGGNAPGAQHQGQVLSRLSSWRNRALPGSGPMVSPLGCRQG